MASRPDNVLANVIANRVEALPDLEVLTIDGGGVRPDDVRTFRQLWSNAQRMAGVLIDQGLQPGEHFALLMSNHSEFVEAMIAASFVGAVFVPIAPRTKGDNCVSCSTIPAAAASLPPTTRSITLTTCAMSARNCAG